MSQYKAIMVWHWLAAHMTYESIDYARHLAMRLLPGKVMCDE